MRPSRSRTQRPVSDHVHEAKAAVQVRMPSGAGGRQPTVATVPGANEHGGSGRP